MEGGEPIVAPVAALAPDARPEGERRERRKDGERRDGFKGKPKDAGRGDRPDRGERSDRGKGAQAKDRQRDEAKPKSYEARPARYEKPIDPDNPFALALSGLRDKLK